MPSSIEHEKTTASSACSKLTELPWGEAGREWMVKPNDKLAGRTPEEAIEAGDGHMAERLVEEMVALHGAFVGLADLYQRYRGVPELGEVWAAFLRYVPNHPWIK